MVCLLLGGVIIIIVIIITIMVVDVVINIIINNSIFLSKNNLLSSSSPTCPSRTVVARARRSRVLEKMRKKREVVSARKVFITFIAQHFPSLHIWEYRKPSQVRTDVFYTAVSI